VDNAIVSVDHYENFPVASVLCPRRMRVAVRAIYAFARTADDIADEGDAPPSTRLADLAAYRADLQAVAAGHMPSGRWPRVYSALRVGIETHQLPVALLSDLLSAFEQDVVQQAYADRAELLDYCRRSANPIGRLLLHLHGVDDAASVRHADAICTALQLINFWQDLGIDTWRGRLYVPLADCVRHGVDSRDLLARRDGANVRSLMRDMTGWSRSLMFEGAPLVRRLPGRSGWELRLVVLGGLRILEKIELARHDCLHSRPVLTLFDWPILLCRAITMRMVAKAGAPNVA
jgi:squalene synthase HpnC